MSSINRKTLLGMAAVMGLGLFAMGVKPVAADPPRHAPAWGWRSKQTAYDNDYRYRNDGRNRGRYDSRTRRNSNDIDRDGIPNSRDWDIDGDRIPNRRDRDIDGDRIPNSRDRNDYDANSRYRRHGDADRDGIRNRRDRDIDGDGRRNWKDRDRDGDNRRNGRDRYDRNPRRR